MKRSKLCLSALSFLLILPGISGAGAPASNGGNDFLIGLWKGIDSEDGSVSLLSITDNDHDGILDLRLTDTYFSICVRDYGLNSFPGLVEGPATVQNATISWAYSMKCYDPASNSLVEVAESNSDIEINRRNKTLTNFGSIFFRIDQH